MPILLIDCYLDATGGYPNFLRYLPKDTNVWQAAHQRRPVELDSITAIVITGSAACVGDDLVWLEELSSFLRMAIGARVPCFGVCFGHQLLAHLCGGRVQKMTNPEVGWKKVTVVQSSALWNGLEESFESFLSHEDEVADLGDDLVLLASSEGCAIQAFEHKKRPIWAIQFHPEMPIPECVYLLNLRAEKHPQLSIDVESEEGRIQSNETVAAQIFRNFIDSVS